MDMQGGLVLTRDQVRQIDELAQARYGLPGIVLMENAGGGAARLINQQYGPRGSAFIACGTGNNGGDGLVIARHLHNAGWTVQVVVAGNPGSMSPDCSANDRVVRAMEISRIVAIELDDQLASCDSISADTVIVDSLLGTGFQGTLRPVLAIFIEQLNTIVKRAMVAIDVPSGLDCDSGQPGGAAIHADLTVTFVARKPGFLTDPGQKYVGRCEVVEIGVPRELIRVVAGQDSIVE